MFVFNTLLFTRCSLDPLVIHHIANLGWDRAVRPLDRRDNGHDRNTGDDSRENYRPEPHDATLRPADDASANVGCRMAKRDHILINGTTNIWRLAGSVDPATLSAAIEEAMNTGEVMHILVELGDSDSPVVMLLNPTATSTVAFVAVEVE